MAPEIPEEWRTSLLREHFDRVKRKNDAGIELPLTASGDEGLVDQRDFFDRRVASKNLGNYYHLKKGEFAYNRSAMNGYPYGAIKRLDRYPDGAVSTLYLCFSLKPSATLDSDFAVHLFESSQLHRELSKICAVGARAHGLLNVRPKEFFDVTLPTPPLPEQRKIAAILSSVDDSIAATRDVIDQTKRVKKGLLQTLMTRGVGHTRFKKTEIGEIPENWEVREISSVADVAYGVTVNQARRQSRERLPLLTVAAHDPQEDWQPEGITDIGVLDGDREKYAAHPGDILLVEGNGNPELLGRPLIWDGRLPNALHQNHLIRVRPSSLESEWIATALVSPSARRHLRGEAKTSSGLYTINSTVVKTTPIPVAPADERSRILSVMESIANMIEGHTTAMSCHLKIKRGLMQDLLTGRVRVQPD